MPLWPFASAATKVTADRLALGDLAVEDGERPAAVAGRDVHQLLIHGAAEHRVVDADAQAGDGDVVGRGAREQEAGLLDLGAVLCDVMVDLRRRAVDDGVDADRLGGLVVCLIEGACRDGDGLPDGDHRRA